MGSIPLRGRWPQKLSAVVAAALMALGTSCFSKGGGVETKIVESGRGQIVVTASGTLEASKLSRVAPQVSGKIIEINVSDGEKVDEGQLLFKIDPAPYQKAADAARSQAATARAAVARLGVGGAPSGNISGGGATRQVMESGKGITPPVLDVSPPANVTVVVPPMPSSALVAAQESDARALVAQVQSAMTAEFKRRVGPLVAGATAQAAAADKEAEKAEAAVEDTEVRAPMAGVVSFLSLGALQDVAGGTTGGERLSVGRVVTAGQPVMAVYDLSDPVARAKVPESEISRVKVGQRGSVKLTAFEGKKFDAQVSRVSLEPGRSELGAIAYQVEMTMPGGELTGWRPGMSATVDIVVEELENVIEVPASAVFTRGSDDYVYVVDNGVVRATKIDAARGGGGKVLVKSGLKSGEKIVVTKTEKVSDGSHL